MIPGISIGISRRVGIADNVSTRVAVPLPPSPVTAKYEIVLGTKLNSLFISLTAHHNFILYQTLYKRKWKWQWPSNSKSIYKADLRKLKLINLKLVR